MKRKSVVVSEAINPNDLFERADYSGLGEVGSTAASPDTRKARDAAWGLSGVVPSGAQARGRCSGARPGARAEQETARESRIEVVFTAKDHGLRCGPKGDMWVRMKPQLDAHQGTK